MASHDTSLSEKLVIDSKWAKLPMILAVAGGILGVIGAATDARQFGYSYLLAFMFFLSICLGGMFLTVIHHLFDASWSVPIRRINEHLAFLLPVMGVLFIPLAVLAPHIWDWMTLDPHADHALHAKQPIFSKPGFFAIAIGLFAIWTLFSYKLRYWSLQQDKTGEARCTFALRKWSAAGIYVFATTLTLAAIMWVKALEHQWFSTMYGVYYFAASVWTTLATVYVITLLLKRTGPLSGVVHRRQFHDIGVLMLTFTVFYAYIHFSQYFLIWNANIPEETFWYVQRESGSWWSICMLIVFGHFLVPFLCLLRIDAKLSLPLMIPLCIWAWMMHFCDMSFNIMPVIHPKGFVLHWMDLGCMAFIGGVLSLVWLKYFRSHPPYPIKDPRLGEALGVHHAGARPPIAAAE
ncbi:MAG TPA: hypothetical protein VGK40_02930 [Verrucomicrobiae bacterium]|jgi:hypothetical protein